MTTATSDFPAITIEWLPNEGPADDTGVFSDITDYVQAASIRSGRAYELDRFDASTLTLQLVNTTRLFDPEWTSGTYYGNLVPMRQIRVTAVWNAVTYPIWRGYITDWGQSIQGADNLIYTTITARDALFYFEVQGLPSSWLELAIAKDRPEHWWRLDETTGTQANDTGYTTSTSRFLYPGEYINAPTLNDVEVVPFDGGRKGVTFDGTTQYVNVLPDASGAAADFTLEIWFIHSASLSGGGLEFLVTIGYTNGTHTDIRLYDPGYVLASCTATGSISSALTTYNDGLPHQAVLRRNGTTLDLFVDGAIVGTDSSTGTTALPVDLFRIGAAPIGNVAAPQDTYLFDGTISNCAFWIDNLTDAQILAHYNAGMLAYTGTDSGAYLDALLTFKNWPATLRDIDTGTSLMGGYELPATMREAIQRIADTEAGQLYVGPDGYVVHRSRTAVWSETRSDTSQATFGDQWSAATLKYVADGFSMPRDDALLRNPVNASRSGGITATAVDDTYTTKYGERTFAAPTAYDSSDNVMLDRANAFLQRYKELGTRLASMTIKPRKDATNLWPQALGRLIGDRITVSRKPLGTGNEISLPFIIEGIDHEFTPRSWSTTFHASPVDDTAYALFDEGLFDNIVFSY